MTLRIVATPLTSGPVTPGLEAISGGYHYQGDLSWTPNDVRYREAIPPSCLAGGAVISSRREQRIAQFKAALAELGYPDPAVAPATAVIKAGRQVGVGDKTAKRYRTMLKQRQEAQAS